MEYCDITCMYVNLPGGFFLACGPKVHGRRSLGSHKPVSGSPRKKEKCEGIPSSNWERRRNRRGTLSFNP